MENSELLNKSPLDESIGIMVLARIVEEHYLSHAITIDKIECTFKNQQEELQLIKLTQNEMSLKIDQRLEQQSEMSTKLDQVLELVSSIVVNMNDKEINNTRDQSNLHEAQFDMQTDDDMIVSDNDSILSNITNEPSKSKTADASLILNKDDDIEVSFIFCILQN